jgi:hypothetical protein
MLCTITPFLCGWQYVTILSKEEVPMTKDQVASGYEVPVGKQPRIYKKGRKPPRGIDPKSFTPEFIKELTQGSKADRDIAAFRWLNARSESDEG